MSKNIVVIIVVAAIVGAGGFFGGMKYQQTKTPSFNRQFVAGNTNGNIRQGNGNPRTGQNFNAVRGEIISSDDKSITVKLNDGSSKIVFFSEKTEYVKSATAAKSDLKSGNTVMIMGSTNSDGSITAQNIQINPLGQVFRGGPTGTPAKE